MTDAVTGADASFSDVIAKDAVAEGIFAARGGRHDARERTRGAKRYNTRVPNAAVGGAKSKNAAVGGAK